ncbi:hypothetical protein O1R50_12495 [Glycomyces luteolus]|uniref:Uncharacterized protein n=1 Tax=Glycomyces luteolus TaxID=2670330 RepID=A0A9X3SRW5_9ACTN|nr:hypothetical protein [Glycomyces luteolus]MDA1360449.1 hypothetical protein [Glycomyces luteolus]
MPLDYFAEVAPDPRPLPTWGAYLQLSDTYDAEAAAAAQRGWPVRRFDGDHLTILTDPRPVVDRILELTVERL